MNPQDNKTRSQQDLDREEQTETQGGGLLGGDDNSSLTSVLGANISSSHTDEDGDTESNDFSTGLGSSTQSLND